MENEWVGKEKNYILNLRQLKATQQLALNQTFLCTSLFQLWKQDIHFLNRQFFDYISTKLGKCNPEA